jgi:hypothetical protein
VVASRSWDLLVAATLTTVVGVVVVERRPIDQLSPTIALCLAVISRLAAAGGL